MCAERFAFPDRDKVHMVIEDRLPRGCAIVLHDFDAIGSQRFFLRPRQFLAKDDDMLQGISPARILWKMVSLIFMLLSG